MRPINHERKSEVFSFVTEYFKTNSVFPTTDQIAESLGMSKSTVSKYMNRLYDEGLIERRGRYRATLAGEIRYVRMPIVGEVACGKPILALEDIEGYIPIDEADLGRGEYFGLRAKGDSMIGVGIDDGDIVYVRRQSTANNGDIVVALVDDDVSGEPVATLKRFFFQDGVYRLHPENDAYSDITVATLSVLGVAVRVLKKLS